MTRVFGRRLTGASRRFGVLLLCVALLFGAGAVVVWWRPFTPPVPAPGWKGAEQAGWIAGIVSAVLSLVSTWAAVAALRGPRARRPRAAAGPADGVTVIGRMPQLASCFQQRRTSVDLARAARAGRSAVLAQVLAGMGGVGKTQLAVRFARDLLDGREIDVLVWVTAASQEAIVSRYAEAATSLGAATTGDGDPERAATALLGWLERTDQRWLVVLDNLDTPADAAGWWPPASPNGRTLVTTRRRDAVLTAHGRVLVDVDLFAPAEAVGFLTRVIGDVRRLADVERLAADLGYLPLALAQAGAYLQDRRLTCAQYRARLADRRRRLAELVPEAGSLPDEHRDTVAATWTLSMEAADALHPAGLAGPLLRMAALLEPNGIPSAVFTAGPVLAHLSGRRGPGRPVDADDARDALRNLHRLSLANLDEDGCLLRVHALLQRAVREAAGPDEAPALVTAAADALLRIWPEIERDATDAQLLRGNTEALHTHGQAHLWSGQNGCHPVLFRAGNSLGEIGLAAAAADYFEAMRRTATDRLGADHADTLTTRHELARWRGEAGDPAGAAHAYTELLDDRLRVLGPDHPETLRTREDLARWRNLAERDAG